jgi:hypothetical protein
MVLVLYLVKCPNPFFLCCPWSLRFEELLDPNRFFDSPDSGSLRSAMLRMIVRVRGFFQSPPVFFRAENYEF